MSWQLMFMNSKDEDRPATVPSFSFVGDKFGKTEEAISFYFSVSVKDTFRGVFFISAAVLDYTWWLESKSLQGLNATVTDVWIHHKSEHPL